jgi:hypothetical protein
VHVGTNGCCTNERHSHPCRHGCIRRDDHFVAGPDPKASEQELERIQPVAYSDAMSNAAKGGEFSFEGFDLRAEDVPPAFEHIPDCFVGLGLKLFDRSA